MKTVLFLDLETSGVDPKVDTIVEIGCVWWSIVFGCTLACWSELVQGPSNAAENVNRIPRAALGLGLPKDHAMVGLRSRVDRADVVVIHNAPFDTSFLPDLGKPVVCSMGDMLWPWSSPGDSLVKVALANGVGITHAHRALTDCEILARLFDRMFEQGGEAGVRAMLAHGMRPKARYAAQVSYDDRDKAKNAGFRWFAERKTWERTMARADVEKLGFLVRELI